MGPEKQLRTELTPEDGEPVCLRVLERAEQECEELRQALRVADEQFERGQVVDSEEAIARLRARIGKRKVNAQPHF